MLHHSRAPYPWKRESRSTVKRERKRPRIGHHRSRHDVTALLRAWGQGDERALRSADAARRTRAAPRSPGAAWPASAADHTLRRRRSSTRRTCAWSTSSAVDWQDRAHFLAMAARLMRRILVDLARARRYQKRGGDAVRVSLRRGAASPTSTRAGPRRASTKRSTRWRSRSSGRAASIELRFFGGLSVEETAAVLEVSADTVKRDWRLAKAWLLREMRGGADRMTPERWAARSSALLPRGARSRRAERERARVPRARPAPATTRCGTRSSRCWRSEVGRRLPARAPALHGAGARPMTGPSRDGTPLGPLRARAADRRRRHGRGLSRARRQARPRRRDQGPARGVRHRSRAPARGSSARRGCSPSLNHPNIARDLRPRGGATASACLVLELVEGETLRRAARRARAALPLDARRWPSRGRSPRRSRPRTRRASSTATSSRRTSRSRPTAS